MALKDKLTVAMRTDVGRVRGNNEDAVADDADLGLIVLADGMGGYNAGEIAAGLAIATILDSVRRAWPALRAGEIDVASGYSVETLALRDAITLAHNTIFQVAQSQPQCAGMGTTVVCAAFHDDRVSIAYVGDSRLYRWRDGRLEQITRDHSLLEELVARGHYSREDATRLVRKNIVTRALGVEERVAVDVLEEPVEVGDIFLACSDGLSDMVPDEGIANILSTSGTVLEMTANALVDAALAAGGRDNVSVILLRADASFARGRRWYERLLEWF
ncbi:Stp1/IreP family PP2C-type Ser/Thr phosphatase [Flagellatimonas centrodinii]|uniref:Stp1/IreP family PP2C-type Ser/Thr phosphatase n=1 Tax=Flagellatimonas centrodinii TaxID=2806210 RepID=UPI001FEE7981|nr:Stp1/IreP family PP2C-type Ser/Thr phosphatase [Flagellatimonas centrodinii]ULQ45765.1 Stp1/IreP family PP2C-type Ser/Thr phosphatase [Flagellatimonas centrodinii]